MLMWEVGGVKELARAGGQTGQLSADHPCAPPPSAEAPEKCKVEHTKALSGDWIDACQGVEGNKKGIYKSIREKGTLPSKESKL